MRHIEYLHRKLELLQSFRDAALAVNDGLRMSEAGDCCTYEGGMNDVEMLRDAEARIVSFEHHHGPADDDEESTSADDHDEDEDEHD